MQQEYEAVAQRQKKKVAIKKKVVSFFARLFKAIVSAVKMIKNAIRKRKANMLTV